MDRPNGKRQHAMCFHGVRCRVWACRDGWMNRPAICYMPVYRVRMARLRTPAFTQEAVTCIDPPTNVPGVKCRLFTARSEKGGMGPPKPRFSTACPKRFMFT